ncbi:T9SS type A sorting domain-containing protein [Neolewinella xylanilytica]|nr:T9SS type A sorting domain-containing protein [Neolewinella xylanilytica]
MGYVLTKFGGSGTIEGTLTLALDLQVTQNVACFGTATGELMGTVSNGTSPYSFTYTLDGQPAGSGSTSEATETLSGVPAGTYAVTVTDANSQTASATVTINQPAQPLDVEPTEKTDVACFGAATGSAAAVGKGGTSPYTYAWSNGATSTSISNLVKGTYTVTVTDANNCTATRDFTIKQPNNPVKLTVTASEVSCNGGSNGTASVVAKDGTGPYTYLWSTGATTASLTGLSAGAYGLTVTDANGCVAMTSATVTQPTALSVFPMSQTNIGCNGDATGAFSVTAQGGTTPYTYLWSNGSTMDNLSGVKAGAYSLTVTDANGCTATTSTTITQPTALLANLRSQTNVACNGDDSGSATVEANGGMVPYTYAWSNGAVTAEATGLSAGSYTVTVTDDYGCTATASVTITEPTLLTASATATDVSCNGGSNGAIDLTVSGGTAPYTYAWNNTATTEDLNDQSPGTYNVTVTDANGCTATATATITEPTVVTASIQSQTNVSCNGGSDGAVDLLVSGGSAPYTFVWSNTATTEDLTNQSAGTYGVTVTDANGCTATTSATVTELPAIDVSVEFTNATCNGSATGTASASATGGTGSFTYEWTNDNDPCTILGKSTGKCEPFVLIGEEVTGLPAGAYTLRAIDGNGCVATESFTISEPTALVAEIDTKEDVTCNGGNDGAAAIQVSGGTAPYTYAWSNGATEANLTNVKGGTYNVIVTDANGCTASLAITINQASTLSAVAFVENNASCSGKADGSAIVNGVRGKPGDSEDFTYAWTVGSETITGDILANVPAGTYSVTVTDGVGCTASTEVTITEPIVLTSSPSQTDVTCNGATNGTATVSLDGGTAPYTYVWSNGATTATTTELAAGIYNVTATDKNGCFTTNAVTITEPTMLAATPEATPDNGMGDGTASITVSGGTTDYTYLWNDASASTTAEIGDLSAGIYTVTVTDANACILTDSVTVILAGDTCTTAMSIDSLFGGELDVMEYSRSYTNGAYGMDSLSDEDLIAYFGTDTLYHPVWFRFTGDGNIYHIRTSDCDDDSALVDTRAILYAGGCSIDSLIRRSDNYSATDSMPLIEVQTKEGEEYTLLIDGADTTMGSFCLSVMQMATVPTREVRPRNLAIYPNPTSGTIRFGRIEVRDVSVFDGYGRRAAHYTNPGNEVDIANLPAGIYYLRITDVDNGLYTSRVIKQ